MDVHYLDNSATTAVLPQAAQKALYMMTENYGNPSSLHKMGINAEAEVERAREIIAGSLGAQAKNIIFTSGGTEANNAVLFGAAEAKKRTGNRVIISAVEHPSVYESAKRLSELGYDIRLAPVDGSGIVKIDEFGMLLNDKTVLVSVMAVNNETGSIEPLEQIAKLIKKYAPNAFFHVDAVQAYCKLPLRPKKLGVDFMTISAHKVHGPKGVGAVYIRDGARLIPLLWGGEQQRKIRPGTESAPLIAAFGAAVDLADIGAGTDAVKELNRYATDRLSSIKGVSFNSPHDALPYIINISVEGFRSETMLHHLEQRGVYVSSSSACAKGKRSYVLAAMGLSDERIDSSVRISFSRYSTRDDIDALCDGIAEGINTLQRK